MTRYIPPNDAEFLAWMNNFISVLNANLATFGLVAADLTPLTNARNDFQRRSRLLSWCASYRQMRNAG
jgi:hypothetical protein